MFVLICYVIYNNIFQSVVADALLRQNIWHFANQHTTRSSTRKSPVVRPSSFVQQVPVDSFPVLCCLLVIQDLEG